MRGIASIQIYWPIATLVLLTGTVFSQTLDFAPSFDDRALIGDGIASTTHPENRQKADGAASFLEPFQTDFWGIATRMDAPTNSPYYRPVPALLIILERSLFKNIAMIRIVHTTLFILSLLLLFLFVLRLYPFLSPAHAAIGCAFFALSPWVADVVLFLSSICDLLVANFTLLALLFFFRFINQGKRRWLIPQGIATLLAMLSKETAYVLPLVFLILFFWSRHRPPSKARIWIPFAISSAILIGTLIIRAVVIKTNTTETLPDAIVSLPWAYSMSLRYTLFPYPLAMETSHDNGVFLASFGASIFIIALLFFSRRPERSYAKIVVSLWFLLLTPSLFAIATSRLFAPRYLFVPSIGLAVGIALLSEWSSKKKTGTESTGNSRLGIHYPQTPKRFGRIALRLGLVIAICANCWLMIDRTVTWKDGITLWSTEINKNPGSLTAHINLSNLLAEQGRDDEALAIMMRTIDLAIAKNQPCQAAAASLNASNLLISSNPKLIHPLLSKQLGRCPRLDPAIKKRLGILSRMNRPY